MAAVTICSDFGAQENNFVTVSIVFPSISPQIPLLSRLPYNMEQNS